MMDQKQMKTLFTISLERLARWIILKINLWYATGSESVQTSRHIVMQIILTAV